MPAGRLVMMVVVVVVMVVVSVARRAMHAQRRVSVTRQQVQRLAGNGQRGKAENGSPAARFQKWSHSTAREKAQNARRFDQK